jgi:hypothetical protein
MFFGCETLMMLSITVITVFYVFIFVKLRVVWALWGKVALICLHEY